VRTLRSCCLIGGLWLLVGPLWAQGEPTFAYIESFRKGSTHVEEQTFQIDLDPKNATCAIHVKDANGRDRYLLECAPETVGQGDKRILGWHVRLEDLKHRIYPNVLMPTPDPLQDKTQIGWLDPGKFAKIRLNMERVVRVDQFFCVFKVRDAHFAIPGQPYLDQMVVEVRFTNTMPHSSIRVQE
jgi:hypothetical protein